MPIFSNFRAGRAFFFEYGPILLKMPEKYRKTAVGSASLVYSGTVPEQFVHDRVSDGDHNNGIKNFNGFVIIKRIIIYYLSPDILPEYRSLLSVHHIHFTPKTDPILLYLYCECSPNKRNRNEHQG
jgi:hypothetical protein